MLALLVWLGFAQAGVLSFVDKGVQIDCGSMGSFVLCYPVLETVAGKLAPSEKKLGEEAILNYPSGVSLKMAITGDKKIVLKFSGDTGGIKTFRMADLLIPTHFGEGGEWKAGDSEKKIFPKEKPAKPHLYQGSVGRFEFSSPEGGAIRFSLPPYSFQQLQDNREWKWDTFAWLFQTPFTEGTSTYEVSVEVVSASKSASVVLVDRFGQSAKKSFPGKIKDEADLKADVASEATLYTSQPKLNWDGYGGLLDSGAKLGLQKTGFFHVEKKGERWFLVNPDGNVFFQTGICGFGTGEDYTYVDGRESIYEWIPPRDGAMGAAWHPNQYWKKYAASYYIANVVRKYGSFTEEELAARMVDRVRAFGFNSVGAFTGISPSFATKNFPYVRTLPLSEWVFAPEVRGVRGVFDPFDEKNLKKMDELFSGSVKAASEDPLLIGYFLANEQAFEDIPRAIPQLDGKNACKRKLVEFLKGRYQTIDAFNAAWALKASSFETLADQGLALTTKESFADMQAYTELFLETYFRSIQETFKKYDKRHLLIGNRWQPGTANSEQLCRISGKYMDVQSINYYTYGIDAGFLKRLYEWGGKKPLLLSEFFYTSGKEANTAERSHEMATQKERGQAYRQYLENAASLGYVVGIEWFTLIDQAVTGRFFSKYNGERYNTGLFNVADRPYADMLSEMLVANQNLYEVLLNGKKPYQIKDARFGSEGTAIRKAEAGLPEGPMAIDGLVSGWPGRPPEAISRTRIVSGGNGGSTEANFKLAWDEKKLYVLVNVVDATPMKNERSGSELWMGDGVELFIGSESLDRGGALLFSDRQILLGAGKNNQFHAVKQASQPAIETAVVPSVDGKGYTLEAAIPWSALGIAPKENLEILFDLAVDDSVDGKDRSWQIVWNGTDRNSGDRGAWGRLRLAR